MPNTLTWTSIADEMSLHEVGFSTAIAVRLKKGARLVRLDGGSTCREEVAEHLQEDLVNETCTWYQPSPASHRRRDWTDSVDRRRQTTRINLGAPQTKQPGVSYLYLGGYNLGDSLRPCCVPPLIHAFDTLVGLPCLLLNPERYRGNWWQTSAEELLPKPNAREIRWYGTDNFFVRHPALLSIVLGLFRQAYALHARNMLGGLEKAAPRAKVTQALNDSDPKLAWKLTQRAEPWIASSSTSNRFPFPRESWPLLGQLHRALYRADSDEVFDADLLKSWGGADGEASWSEGFHSWTGSRNGSTTRKRLARLGR